LFILTVNSCDNSDDDVIVDLCENVTCNNGTCNEGSCICDLGYSGEFCENFDICAGVTCINGGVCNGGICNCPPGFAGVNCQTPLQPDSIKIHRIEVVYYYNCDVNPVDYGFFGLRYLIQNQEYLDINGLDINLSNGDDFHDFFTPVVVPFSSTQIMQVQFYTQSTSICGELIHNPIIDGKVIFNQVNSSIYKFWVLQSDGNSSISQGEFSIYIYCEKIFI
jgi:hypothetical protein